MQARKTIHSSAKSDCEIRRKTGDSDADHHPHHHGHHHRIKSQHNNSTTTTEHFYRSTMKKIVNSPLYPIYSPLPHLRELDHCSSVNTYITCITHISSTCLFYSLEMDKKLEILACIFPCLYKTYSTSAVLNYNAIFKACNAKI